MVYKKKYFTVCSAAKAVIVSTAGRDHNAAKIIEKDHYRGWAAVDTPTSARLSAAGVRQRCGSIAGALRRTSVVNTVAVNSCICNHGWSRFAALSKNVISRAPHVKG